MTAKLVLSINGNVQDEFQLNQDRTTIGRKSNNTIQIDNLAISSRHALITTVLEDSFLEDLGSTNGTYVNGKLIKKHALRSGDIIALGKHELKYANDEQSLSDDVEKTMIIQPKSASAASAMLRAVEDAGANPIEDRNKQKSAKIPDEAKLLVLNGPAVGKELVLHKALLSLGKRGTQVAVISRRVQGYFLMHIESDGDGKRYPLVNSEPIGPKKYHLKDGDIIELAGIKMEFKENNQQD